MTERQYNSKLLSDKLAQLPVPPNDALWSRIEVQLQALPPVVHHPPAKAVQPTKLAKAVLVKTTVAVFATILLIVFIIWLVNKKTHSQKAVPAVEKAKPQVIADTTKNDTAVVMPVRIKNENELALKPVATPATADTQAAYTPLLPGPKTMDVPLRDTLITTTPAATPLHADTLKPLPQKKKEEDYYFEVKKKKKDSVPE